MVTSELLREPFLLACRDDQQCAECAGHDRERIFRYRTGRTGDL
jgi:hypothetical protein